MSNKIKMIGIISLIVVIITLSGCTSPNDTQNTPTDSNNTVNTTQSEVEHINDSKSNVKTDETPIDGKYNTILYNDSHDPVWNTDTCPLCGEHDAEAQTATEHLIFNKCLKCGYDFISIRKY